MINDDDNDNEWENSETIVLNVEQLKKIREQKLVEESDTALARELFEQDETLKEMRMNELKQVKTYYSEIKYTKNDKNDKNIISKKEENELKQTEISKKIKKQKMLKARYHELFGEAEFNQDEYADYEDKFL